MDKINITSAENFPFSLKTASKILDMIGSISKLTGIGGGSYILSGCEEVDGVITDGFIVLNKELLPFVGGEAKPYIAIEETREDTSAFGVTYPDAYINRCVVLTDVPGIEWGSVIKLVSNEELAQRIDQIKGDPPGIRVSWDGLLDKIPENYMVCDGRTLNIADYPVLYANIGTLHGSVGTTQFKLPNFGGRFSVAYSDDEDYNTIGEIGGEEWAELLKENLPEHDHLTDPLFNRLSVKASDLTGQGTVGSGQDSNNANQEYRIGNMTEILWDKATIKSVGNGVPHENRPPYLVEAFIIKVKY